MNNNTTRLTRDEWEESLLRTGPSPIAEATRRERLEMNQMDPLPSISIEEIAKIHKRLDDLRLELFASSDGFSALKRLQEWINPLRDIFGDVLEEDIAWLAVTEQKCFQRYATRDELADELNTFCESLSRLFETKLRQERSALVDELKVLREMLINDQGFKDELLRHGVFSHEMGEMLTDAIMKVRHPDAFL